MFIVSCLRADNAKADRKRFHPERKKLRIYGRPFNTQDDRKMFSHEIQFRKVYKWFIQIIVLFVLFIAQRAQSFIYRFLGNKNTAS